MNTTDRIASLLPVIEWAGPDFALLTIKIVNLLDAHILATEEWLKESLSASGIPDENIEAYLTYCKQFTKKLH